MSSLYNDNTLAIFLNNWSEAVRTALRLQLSLSRLSASFPLEAADLLTPSDDLLDGLDAFRVRYSDLQDCLGSKLFRGILLLEEEQVTNTLDILHKMEKRKIVKSVTIWREQRAIRNAFAHDYPNCESDKAEALNAAWQAAPHLILLLKNIKTYFKDNLTLNLDGLKV